MHTRAADRVLPRRNVRALRAILGANAVSAVGDGAFVAAAPLVAAMITRNPAGVAIVATAEALPWLVVSPLAGVFVDRWPRRPTMIVADGVRVAAVGALAGLVATGTPSITAISACAFVVVSGTVFHSACAEAMIANLAQRNEHVLNSANGRLHSTTTAGRQLLGPPAGSWSFATAGWLPFAADALSFLASALLLRCIPPDATPPAGTATAGILTSMREGAAYLVHHRQLRRLAVLTAAANLSANAGLATLVLYATDDTGLALSPARYGLLLSAMSIGGLLTGVAAPRLLAKAGSRTAFIDAMLAESAAWLAIVYLTNTAVTAMALAVVGAAVTLKSVVIMSSRQRLVPTELLGRVISAYRIVGNGAAPIGALLGGIACSTWGLQAPMVMAAAVLCMAAALAIPALRGIRPAGEA